jgi:hypothetical protein
MYNSIIIQNINDITYSKNFYDKTQHQTFNQNVFNINDYVLYYNILVSSDIIINYSYNELLPQLFIKTITSNYSYQHITMINGVVKYNDYNNDLLFICFYDTKSNQLVSVNGDIIKPNKDSVLFIKSGGEINIEGPHLVIPGGITNMKYFLKLDEYYDEYYFVDNDGLLLLSPIYPFYTIFGKNIKETCDYLYKNCAKKHNLTNMIFSLIVSIIIRCICDYKFYNELIFTKKCAIKSYYLYTPSNNIYGKCLQIVREMIVNKISPLKSPYDITVSFDLKNYKLFNGRLHKLKYNKANNQICAYNMNILDNICQCHELFVPSLNYYKLYDTSNELLYQNLYNYNVYNLIYHNIPIQEMIKQVTSNFVIFICNNMFPVKSVNIIFEDESINIEELFEYLGQNPKIKKLKLHFSKNADNDTLYLVLKHLKLNYLESLTLSGFKISNYSFFLQSMKQIIHSCTKLTDLYLISTDKKLNYCSKINRYDYFGFYVDEYKDLLIKPATSRPVFNSIFDTYSDDLEFLELQKEIIDMSNIKNIAYSI